MNTSFSWAQFDSFTRHKMLMILGLLAVLLVPSLTEGKKVKDLFFVRYEDLHNDWIYENRLDNLQQTAHMHFDFTTRTGLKITPSGEN